MHQAKIPEMKSISKPRLATEIYTFWENLSTEDFSSPHSSYRANTQQKPLSIADMSWKQELYWLPKVKQS